MCGFRAPSMAMGEFRAVILEVWSWLNAEVVVLTTGLSREKRQVFLEGAAAAREAFVTYLDMKCAVYEQFPLVLAALAHADARKARNLCLRLADTYDKMTPAEQKRHHPLTRAILDRSGVVRAEFDEFVLTGNVLPHLNLHKARLRFIMTTEAHCGRRACQHPPQYHGQRQPWRFTRCLLSYAPIAASHAF